VGQAYAVITLDAQGEHQYHAVEVDDAGGRGTAVIKVNDKNYAIHSNSRLNDIAIEGTVNGQPFTAQVERGSAKNPLVLQVQHHGRRIDALVVSPRMAELYRQMPFKAPPDLSRFVLSPMPGLLVDVSVTVGQKVQAGERVAVIEAMKMENVLFAAQDGVVKSVMATKGESLTVDQVIVEFA
jgi:propionyl-CoA carboxylase alpha chain